MGGPCARCCSCAQGKSPASHVEDEMTAAPGDRSNAAAADWENWPVFPSQNVRVWVFKSFYRRDVPPAGTGPSPRARTTQAFPPDAHAAQLRCRGGGCEETKSQVSNVPHGLMGTNQSIKVCFFPETCARPPAGDDRLSPCARLRLRRETDDLGLARW